MADFAQCRMSMEKRWVRQQLRGKGDQAALAKHLGVSESLMSKILSDKYKRELREKEATKIREFFRPESRAERYAGMHGESTVQEPDGRLTLPEVTEMPPDILAYRAGPGRSGAGGNFTMSLQEVALRVRRPEKLADRTDIYGLFVRGDTMSTRYEDGELILLETGPPPQKGDHVVVMMKVGDDGVQYAYLKLLVSWVGDQMELKQYKPEGTITLDANEVDKVHRVLTLKDIVSK